ncbi:Hint domain-containing protein [Chitinophaga qingshengii]|uniref:Hint domain-containing protein n=1 Tax=Chitinophaga qingshengii TaxID=1569794 RepID=A0ABR7TQL2_9BACT|nr:Hint domain-containing protein [Chitinophaga qingshengii]MBC9932779.1 hypothetical protein [Chitinophaga qingshengii]
MMKTFYKYLILPVLLLWMHTAVAENRDSVLANIIARGREQFRQLQAQNQRNEQEGHAERNEYVLNIVTADAPPEREFIKQRELKQLAEGELKGRELLVKDITKLDTLNARLRRLNEEPGNKIKTYLLLLDFVPMYFDREVPPKTTLEDLFAGRVFEEDANNKAAHQAQAEAETVIKDITGPFLKEQGAVTTLFCGFLKFRTFFNSKSAREIVVYYPHHNIQQPTDADSYQKLLGNYIAGIAYQSGEQFMGTFIAGIGGNNREYIQLADVRGKILQVNNAFEMEGLLKPIDPANYIGLSLEERVHSLKVLSGEDIPDRRETMINQLLEATPADQITDLLASMQKLNDKVPPTYPGPDGAPLPNPKIGWCLMQSIIYNTEDEVLWWGKNNYQRLMQAFTRLTMKSPALANALEAYYTSSDVEKRKIIWDRSYALALVSRMPVGTNRYDVTVNAKDGSLVLSKEQLTHYVTKTASSRVDGAPGVTASISYEDPVWEKEGPVTLQPFDLVSFTNRSDLNLLADVAGPVAKKGEDIREQFVPAIVLQYAQDKKMNQDIGKGIEMGLDVLTLAIPVSKVVYLGKVANYIYRGIEISAQVGAVANLALNTDVVTPGSDLAIMIKKYQAITALLQLTNIGATIKNAQLARVAKQEAAEFLESYYRAEPALASMAESQPAVVNEMKQFSRELEQAGEAAGYGKAWYASLKNTLNKAFAQTIERFKNVSFLKQESKNGIIRFLDNKNEAMAHTLADGSLVVDKTAEVVGENSKVLDIVEGAHFRSAENAGEVTEDLLVIQQADGSIVCIRGACFVAGTPVHTRNGLKPIEQVNETDQVLSLDTNRKDTVWQPVLHTFRRQASRLIRIIAGKDTLFSTPEHPFLTEDGWQSAALLYPGREIRLADNNKLKVLAVLPLDTTVTVYNMEVSGTHNYCVGTQAIVVHNTCQILARLRSRFTQAAEFDKFAEQLNGKTNILTKFDNGELSLDSWRVLQSSKKARADLAHLMTAESILSKGFVSPAELKTIILTNGTLKKRATAIGEFLADLDHFGDYMRCSGFEQIVTALQKSSYGSADGANWVLTTLRRYRTEFPAAHIRFEVPDGVFRRYDVIFDDGRAVIFYELKSYQTLPPTDFARQFLHDLENSEINNLKEDIKWWFDKDKLDMGGIDAAAFKSQMTDALKNIDYSAEVLKKFSKGKNKLTKAAFLKMLDQNFNDIFQIK